MLVRELPAAANVDRLRAAARAREPAAGRRRRRRAAGRARSGCAGAPVRAPARRCCSAPKRARCSTAAASPSPDDVARVALPVLRHRLLLNFQAEADGIDADRSSAALLEAVPRVTRSDRESIDARCGSSRSVVARNRRSRARRAASSSKDCASGLHRSPFHGYSAEFSQHRPYRPGDDLKYLDWKLFARTDRAVHEAVPRDDELVGDDRARHERVDGVSWRRRSRNSATR